ncbi:Ribonuclease H-like superfamily [Sesbania bispinosa]|nr:Ribonuclease H-like superfamily [Sesbania bispinosa]
MDLGDGESSVWYADWTGLGPLCNQIPFVHISDTHLQVKQLWHNGVWDFTSLATHLPEQLIDTMRSITIPPPGANGTLLLGNGIVALTMLILLEKDIFGSRRGTALLILITLGVGRHVCEIATPLPKYGADWVSMLNMISNHLNCRGPDTSLFLAAVWWLWLWRNNSVFSPEEWDLEYVMRNIFLMNDVMLRSTDLLEDSHRQNAFTGGVLRDDNGQWIAGFSCREGVGSILFTELRAVLRGIQLAWHKLICESDSVEVVRLLHLSTVPDGLPCKELLLTIRGWMNKFTELQVTHVLREANMVAHSLAKSILLGNEDFRLWHSPPSELCDLLAKDFPP